MTIERKHRCSPPGPLAGFFRRLKPGDVFACEECGARWELLAPYYGERHPHASVTRKMGKYTMSGFYEWPALWVMAEAAPEPACASCEELRSELARMRAEISGYRG